MDFNEGFYEEESNGPFNLFEHQKSPVFFGLNFKCL